MEFITDNLTALLALTAIALGFGALLGFAAVKFRVEGNPIVEQIDALLPRRLRGQQSVLDLRLNEGLEVLDHFDLLRVQERRGAQPPLEFLPV